MTTVNGASQDSQRHHWKRRNVPGMPTHRPAVRAVLSFFFWKREVNLWFLHHKLSFTSSGKLFQVTGRYFRCELWNHSDVSICEDCFNFPKDVFILALNLFMEDPGDQARNFRTMRSPLGSYISQSCGGHERLLRCFRSVVVIPKLVGGFKRFLFFTPNHGDLLKFDEHIFQMVWTTN